MKQILDTCGLDQRNHIKKFSLKKGEREKRTGWSPDLEGSCDRGVGIYGLPLPPEFIKKDFYYKYQAKMEIGIDYSNDRRIKFRVYGGNKKAYGIKPDIYHDEEIIWEIDALAPNAEEQLDNSIAQAWQKRVIKEEIYYASELNGNQGAM